MKTCSRCHTEKSLEEFSPSKQTKDGKFSYCKICCTELGAIRYHANKEKYQEKHRKYYLDHAEEIKPRQRANGKIYYENNREECLEYSRNYYKDNKEQTIANGREWRRRNPERANAIRNRHRDAKRGASIVDLTYEQWEEIKKAWNYRCAYCDKKTKLTMDHLTPVSEGGNHTASNIVPACRSCNAKKGNKEILKPVQPILLTIATPKPLPPIEPKPETTSRKRGRPRRAGNESYADLFAPAPGPATVTASVPVPVPGGA